MTNGKGIWIESLSLSLLFCWKSKLIFTQNLHYNESVKDIQLKPDIKSKNNREAPKSGAKKITTRAGYRSKCGLQITNHLIKCICGVLKCKCARRYSIRLTCGPRPFSSVFPIKCFCSCNTMYLKAFVFYSWIEVSVDDEPASCIQMMLDLYIIDFGGCGSVLQLSYT